MSNNGPWGGFSPGNNNNPKKNNVTPLRGGSSGGSSGGGGANIPEFNFDFGKHWLKIVIAGIFIWLATGIYIVKADEQGVVLRFGAFNRTVQPGVHYALPYPFEQVFRPKVTFINTEEIGFRSSNIGTMESKSPVFEERLMLTGDENIIDVSFIVQWRISNARDFLFNIREPKQTVKDVSESAMRSVVGSTAIDEALSTGRGRIQDEATNIIQSVLDSYKAGITITRVELRDAFPPTEVIDAFKDVQAAKADAEQIQNRALAYRNDILPRARGEAEKLIQQAKAYKEEVIADAEGKASRFLAVYNQYKNSKEVTRDRIYIDTMEHIMKNTPKTIMQSGDSGSSPLIPLLQLNGNQPSLLNRDVRSNNSSPLN